MLVDCQRVKWKNEIKNLRSVLRLAYQVTRKDTSEVVTGTIGFVDDDGKENQSRCGRYCLGDAEDGLYLGSSWHSPQLP